MPKKPTDKSKEIDYQQEFFKRQYEDSKCKDAYLDEIRKIPDQLNTMLSETGHKSRELLKRFRPNQEQPTGITSTTSPDGRKTTIHIPGVQGKMETVGDLQRRLMGQSTPEPLNTEGKPHDATGATQDKPAGATVNTPTLFFTYNKQARTLTITNNHGKPMKLSKQKAKLFDLLKKPKGIRLILKKLYFKEIEKNQKITDGKRNSYDSFASKFNEDWRNHFKFNEELKLIQCENEIVSIVQIIDWK